jgi:hypothetical protein
MFGFDETREIVSDNTPTERLDAPQPAGGGAAVRRPNRLVYVLIALGLALLLALIFVVVLMLSNNSRVQVLAIGSPSPNPSLSDGPNVSASPAPSLSESEPPSPSASQTKAAPKPDTKPHFTTFTVPSKESGCGKGPYVSYNPPVKMAWVAANAESVWFVQGTDDAADSQNLKIPNSGNQDSIDENYRPIFPCNGHPATYTLTIVGTDGTHYSKHWTVTDTIHN